jgi:hypothetical protein
LSVVALLVMSLVLVAPTRANAQAALFVLLFGDRAATESFHFSLKAGANITDFSNVEGTKRGFGPNFGLLATIKLSDSFFVVPEFAALSRKGIRDIALRPTGNADLDGLLQDPTSTSRALNYIDVPVVAAWRLHRKYYVGAGPQVSFLTSATDRFRSSVFREDDLRFHDDIKPELNTVDAGVVLEAGMALWEARGGKGLNIHARYTFGLTDIVKNNPGEAVRISGLQVSVSFPFVAEQPAEDGV